MVRRSLSLLLAAVTIALSVVTATAAHAGPGESDFVSRANSARSANGLRPYSVRSDLIAVARRHAARMAAKGSIWHNPNLGSEVDNWQAIGENVGMGGSVASIHQAFMDSPGHRANILDRDFTEIGVGTATDAEGRIFVTQVFRKPMSSSTTTTAPAPSTTTTQPRTTTTVSRPRVTQTSTTVRPAAAARPAPRRVDPAAVLRARLAAITARRGTAPHGLLDSAVNFHLVMTELAA